MNFEKNFENDENLVTRRKLYDYESPRINIHEKVIDELLKQDPKSILDIGCGNGDFLFKLRDRNYKGPLTGIDISKGMVEKANENKGDRKIMFQTMDAHNMSFENDKFDIVVCNFTMHLFRSIPQAIIEISRVLKPEGLFIGTLHAIDNLPKRKKYIKHALELLPETKATNTMERVTLMNVHTFIDRFENPKTSSYRAEIKLENPGVYLEYFDTLRSYVFSPDPEEDMWKSVLEMIENKITEEINENGHFTETTHVGFFKSQKPFV